MEHRDHFDFVPPHQAAKVLGVSEATLQRWRASQSGPSYTRVGGRIRYSYPYLLEYIEAQTCRADQQEVAC